jgi:formamidopyrimidine-DNA glycosylase
MPEGPEVKRHVLALNALLSGTNLVKVKLLGGPYIHSEKHSVLRQRVSSLNKTISDLKNGNIKIEKVKNKGKQIYIQIRLISKDKNGVKFISTHLGMTGCWKKTKSKHSLIEIRYEKNGKIDSIFLDDYRRFSAFEILSVKEMREKILSIGPDVLGENFKYPVFIKAFKPYSNSKRLIADILSDQSIISGIGNYLRSEILYVAKISPTRMISTLDAEELRMLYKAIKYVIKSAYSKGGISKYDEEDIPLHGHYEPIVYEKELDPNGEEVKTVRIQNRTVYWVPSAQK